MPESESIHVEEASTFGRYINTRLQKRWYMRCLEKDDRLRVDDPNVD
jgi:hypothetical protein